jgi:hypothetical protein
LVFNIVSPRCHEMVIGQVWGCDLEQVIEHCLGDYAYVIIGGSWKLLLQGTIMYTLNSLVVEYFGGIMHIVWAYQDQKGIFNNIRSCFATFYIAKEQMFIIRLVDHIEIVVP